MQGNIAAAHLCADSVGPSSNLSKAGACKTSVPTATVFCCMCLLIVAAASAGEV